MSNDFRHTIFYSRVTSATPHLLPRLESELEGVPAELLITYRFLTGSDVSRVKIVSQTMLFIEKSDCRRSLSPTSVGSLTGLNSFKAVQVRGKLSH
ncbi:TPA: hypothetical protein U1613_000751 [Streptococcus suis]|uniref:hypothetical protein n=1 Tax=Streptococcus suis TaxID=1307 RepID=UPI00129E1857|nr:hypothetical protein [Streptococcus suis]NQP67501.1 hypothetical protein [Streptococcus suis]HEM5495089.1 hypothetical protein [Streptococcus suis]HEM5496733.1 hypothetical protein [Streptococcus suis]